MKTTKTLFIVDRANDLIVGRVTDCGGTCVAGEIKITSQPCGSAKPVTRHSTEKDSQLCCPLAAAPDPSTCTWRGTASACNGHCQNNEVMLEQNRQVNALPT
jgi:chitinase